MTLITPHLSFQLGSVPTVSHMTPQTLKPNQLASVPTLQICDFNHPSEKPVEDLLSATQDMMNIDNLIRFPSDIDEALLELPLKNPVPNPADESSSHHSKYPPPSCWSVNPPGGNPKNLRCICSAVQILQQLNSDWSWSCPKVMSWTITKCQYPGQICQHQVRKKRKTCRFWVSESNESTN